MKLKELVALVYTKVTLTQYEKGGVVSQELIFNMQQGHMPVRLHGLLVYAEGLKRSQLHVAYYFRVNVLDYVVVYMASVCWLQLPDHSLFPLYFNGKRDLSHKATLGTKAFKKDITV